jgi:hypothetical protein
MIGSSFRIFMATAALLAVMLVAFPLTVLAQEETVCIQCHAGQPGRLGAPMKAWLNSIHQANGISCHDCHGGDPTDFATAMLPESGFQGVPDEEAIPGFCGKCHVGVQEDYLRSAHGQALAEGGPQCVTCHGNHDIRVASLELINDQDCSRCHEYGRASEIKSALAGTDSRIVKLESEISGLKRQGIDVEALQGKTFAFRNDFHRLFHTVNLALVKEQSIEFDQRFQAIESGIVVIKDDLSARKMWGAGVVFLLLLAGVIGLQLNKAYHEEG